MACDRLRRPVDGIEWVALGAALVPFVVALVRAGVQDWMPMGDAAYFTVRSRDVFTAHWPFVGAWSSGSLAVGVPVNNLGPMQLDLLAPFTKVSPYLGTGIGSAVINAVSVGLVWFVARRLFGPRRVALVMAATLLLMATFGLSWLIDARPQYGLVLPFYALLWLTAGMWAGVGSAVPLGLAVASLVVQTHFTYVYGTVIVTAAGVIAYTITVMRDRPPAWRRAAGWAAVVLAVCWVQPLIDQFFGSGNLGDVLGAERGGESGPGLGAGVQVLAGGSLVPPFWLPGSIGTFLQPHDGVTLRGAVVGVLLWSAAAALLVLIGRRIGSRVPAALGAAAFAALIGGLAGATLTPVTTEFGFTQQNYYWVWAVGAFLTSAVVTGGSTTPAIGRRLRWLRPALLSALCVGAVTAICAIAAWPRYPVASVALNENEADRVGQPLRRELERVLALPDFPRTVEFDFSRTIFNQYPYVLLTELQRAGIEFRFPPGSRNLDRFGESRCAEWGKYPRLSLIADDNPRLGPESRVLFRIVGITGLTADELDEHAALEDQFGDLLRAGTVAVDVGAVSAEPGGPLDELQAVLATPDEPAAGLARHLEAWRLRGHVRVPSDQRQAFDRWVELDGRVVKDYQTVALLPAGESDEPANEATTTC